MRLVSERNAGKMGSIEERTDNGVGGLAKISGKLVWLKYLGNCGQKTSSSVLPVPAPNPPKICNEQKNSLGFALPNVKISDAKI